MTLEELRSRFWKNVDCDSTPSGCWTWIGPRNHSGYGIFDPAKQILRTRVASRVSWLLAGRDIPKGLCVMHKCDNPPCVRLEHLAVGTPADNVHDAIAKSRMSWQKRTQEMYRDYLARMPLDRAEEYWYERRLQGAPLDTLPEYQEFIERRKAAAALTPRPPGPEWNLVDEKIFAMGRELNAMTEASVFKSEAYKLIALFNDLVSTAWIHIERSKRVSDKRQERTR